MAAKSRKSSLAHVVLMPGESRSFEIFARPKWNGTELMMRAGERYRFAANGTWSDATIPSGPEGYKCNRWFFRLTERFRRRPADNWFALIGAVGENELATFLIGSEAVVTVVSDGVLNCYANDLRLLYCNNSGAITLKVTREA